MRKTLVVLGTLLLAMAGTACSNKLSGSAKGSTKSDGDISLSPTDCYSGEREQFFGVQLEDSKSGTKLRAVKPATDDWQVVVEGSKAKLTLKKGDCSKFDIAVTKQNSKINNISNVEGHLTLDCKSGDDTFTSDITFANCH